jgi:hypothetical protein
MKLIVSCIISLVFACANAVGANPAVNYTGHYEMANSHGNLTFSLDITQTGSTADISFSASMADGSNASPDGDGKGDVAAGGVLTFKFKDSFGNEGVGTLVAVPNGYHLDMEMTKVLESRAVHFYGNIQLKKTANKPSSS